MKRNLLIADSNTSELQTLQRVFSNLEEITPLPPAATCEETLRALNSDPKPDILLLDLILHGGDGLLVLDAVDALPKAERPLVFLMTAISHERLLLALQERVVFCFIKPFQPERVLYRVLQLGCTPEQGALCLRKDDPYFAEISRMLLSIGVPAHLRGYHYIRDAVRLYLTSDYPMKLRITRDIYPVLAKEHNDKPNVIENAIRFAIDFAWTYGDLDVIHSLFGYTTNERHGKPGNAEFIAMIAEHIRVRHGF